jgi:hypothetical protein
LPRNSTSYDAYLKKDVGALNAHNCDPVEILPCKSKSTRIVDQNDLQEAQFCIVCWLCPVRERLQNYEECSPSVVLVKTVSSMLSELHGTFPFFLTSMSFMLCNIHGTFNLFYVLLVL